MMHYGFPRTKRCWTPPTAGLLLIIAVVLVGLVATVLPALPRSAAADVGGVTITKGGTEAVIKDGMTDVCVIRSTTSFSGDDESKAHDYMTAMASSAGDAGMKVETQGLDLILSQEFDLTAWSIAPAECSMDSIVSNSRGRSALELPEWARGFLAAAANVVVYVAVTLAIMALFTFLAPEFEVYGLMVSGCIAGFTSSYVGNLINQVPQQSNLTYSAAKCVAGAIQNITLGKVVSQMTKALRSWLGNDLGDAASSIVMDNLSLGASSRRSIANSLDIAARDLAEELPVP